MIKKFENFVNESVDSGIREIRIKDLKEIIERAKPGDNLFIVCHILVNDFIENHCECSSVDGKEEINCSLLSPGDKNIDTLFSDNTLYILSHFERTDMDVFDTVMNQILDNKDSVIAVCINNSEDGSGNQDYYKRFMYEVQNSPALKDRFHKCVKVVLK